MTGSRHIIRRQTLIVDAVDPEGKAALLQQQMGELYRQHLLPVIDRCCSRWSPPGARHQIDRLEIDLGKVDLERIDNDWIRQAAERIERELTQALQQTRKEAQATPLASATELLKLFLKTGVLPWWADGGAPDVLEKAMEEALAGGTSAEAFFRGLKTDLLHQGVGARRLIQAFSDDLLLRLTLRLHPARRWEDSLISGMRAYLSQRVMDWIVVRRSFWPAVWGGLALPLLPDQQAEWIWAELRQRNLLPADAPAYWREVEGSGKRETTGNHEPPEQPFSATEQNQGGEEAESDDSSTHDQRLNEPISPEAHDTHRALSLSSDAVAEKGETPGGLPGSENEPEELYLYNAGLVLLAPFLPRSFEQLGWTEENRFLSSELALIAVTWLQYLCDGQGEPPEYQLVLNKILCGLPPDALYEPPRALSAEERQAADELLAAALEQAPGLGLTTIDGLRGSFLLRRGILRPSGNHWLLHVEAETYDIVLSRVPWPFQVVVLPWMEAPIRVDWNS